MRIAIAVTLSFLSTAPGCRASTELVVGGVYSIADEDGRFGVVKLLARGDGICHVRVYKQKYASRPLRIDLSSLSLGASTTRMASEWDTCR